MHCQIYLRLRAIVQQHIASGEAPILKECEKPTGSWNWVGSQDSNMVEEIDIYQDGGDEAMQETDFVFKSD